MGPVPTSIKVISILGIIYSALGLLASPCSVFLTFHPLTPNPAMDTLHHDATYVIYYIISMTIHFIMALVLLAGSIASLKLKPIGRSLMLGYAYALIVVTLINVVLTVVLVTPKMSAVFAADPALPPGTAKMMGLLSILGVAFALILCAAISGVILYFFNRPIARNAFQGIFPAQPTHFPVEFPPEIPPAS